MRKVNTIGIVRSKSSTLPTPQKTDHMSELAVATTNLSKKKEDATRIMNEMHAWEELHKTTGVHGLLSMTVEDVRLAGGASIITTLLVKYLLKASGEMASPDGDAAEENVCSVKEKFMVPMKSKESTIHFFASYRSSDNDSEPITEGGVVHSFTACFDCKDAPEDTSLTCQLDTTSSTVVFKIKVCGEGAASPSKARLHDCR